MAQKLLSGAHQQPPRQCFCRTHPDLFTGISPATNLSISPGDTPEVENKPYTKNWLEQHLVIAPGLPNAILSPRFIRI